MSNLGTSTFPGTLDAFTAPGTGTFEDSTGYEHDLLHAQEQDAVEKIETVLGTTGGTSVIGGWSAGDFPIKSPGGTLNNGVLGTPTITGTVGGTTTFAAAPEIAGKAIPATESAWADYSPTFGGANMSFATTTATFARYTQIGKTVYFQIHGIGTTGGTASDNCEVTLPVVPANATNKDVGGGCYVVNSTHQAGHWGHLAGGTIRVRLYDSAGNWGTGAGREMIIQGFYEVS